MSKLNILYSFIFLILINVDYCLANNYLYNKLPTIINGLKSNNDDLIAQQRIIYITKQTLNELVNKKKITTNQSDQTKKELETIFEKNFKQASNYQRAMYTMKRPFQFIYQKITNPQAGYLERFAYGAAAAVGVAITSYTIYHGVQYARKYAYFALQDWQKNDATQKPNISDTDNKILNTVTFSPSFTKIQSALNKHFNHRREKLVYDISRAIGGTITSPIETFKTVSIIVNIFYSEENLEPVSESFVRDISWDIVRESIYYDKPDILNALLHFYNTKPYLGGERNK